MFLDGHKGCPTFVNKGGLCAFKRLLENREKYSEDGILTLLTCISLVAAHWNLRSYCIDADIIPVILNAMKDNKNPQVDQLSLYLKKYNIKENLTVSDFMCYNILRIAL
jgi:hypothetical protein